MSRSAAEAKVAHFSVCSNAVTRTVATPPRYHAEALCCCLREIDSPVTNKRPTVADAHFYAASVGARPFAHTIAQVARPSYLLRAVLKPTPFGSLQRLTLGAAASARRSLAVGYLCLVNFLVAGKALKKVAVRSPGFVRDLRHHDKMTKQTPYQNRSICRSDVRMRIASPAGSRGLRISCPQRSLS